MTVLNPDALHGELRELSRRLTEIGWEKTKGRQGWEGKG